MNYFIEGLQGAGKSTLVQRLSNKYKELEVFHEGDYSPVELAWCAYLTESQYKNILKKYSEIRENIEGRMFLKELTRLSVIRKLSQIFLVSIG